MGYLASFLVAAVAVSTVSATNYYCSSPRAPYHGYYSGYSSSYRAGHVIYYYCDRGYQLYGSRRSVCYYDSHRYSSYWNYPAPVCRRHGDDDDDTSHYDSSSSSSSSSSSTTTRVIDCGKLPNPTGGVVKLSGTKLGSIAKYRCNEGYVLKGRSSRKCLYSGKWSGEAPVCKPVDCGDLDDPAYGDVDFTTTTFRSKATYSCNDGFILVGVKTRICQANGKWSGDAPTCKPVDCGDLDDPAYGDVDFTTTTFRSKATYSCDDGFFLVGVKTRVCQANGKWSGDAPVCKPVDCGDLDDPRYGDVDFSSTTFRSKATYSCDKGFILVGVKIRVCQANGKWSGDAPTCKRVDCGRLRDPRYGDVDFTTTTFESKATYSCNKGFILVGVKTRVCQANGKWSGDMPVCKRRVIDCGRLQHPSYGRVKYRCTTYNCNAYYSCNHGYRLYGDYRRVCQYSGYWSGHAPRCTRYGKKY